MSGILTKCVFKMANEVDVLIIGAGLCGLRAAKELKENGLSICILEARDRVGGRTCTLAHEEYGSIDLGAQYVGETQEKVLKLVADLGLETDKVYLTGKSVLNFKTDCKVTKFVLPNTISGMLTRQMKQWKQFTSNSIMFWNPFKVLDINNLIQTMDRMARKVPRQAPWTAENAEKLDSMTFKEFVEKISWTRSAADLCYTFIRSVLSSEPHEVSLLYVLWFINSGGGVHRLSSVRDGAQEMKIIGGTQQLSEGLAKHVGQENIFFNSAVVAIDQSDTELVHVMDIKGKQYKAKYVICTVPQPLISKIHFTPPLPDLRQQLIQRMPMGSIIKTFMYYDKAYWREQGYCGEAVTNYGAVTYCLDSSKPDGSHPCIMGFILADKARELAEVTEEERKQLLTKYYANTFRIKELLAPVGYVEKNWMEEEYSGGCYLSVMAPGVLTSYGKVLRRPVGRVHFGGTEMATEWAGYMDGALQSGERVAAEILDIMAIKWNENVGDIEFPTIPSPSLAKMMVPSICSIIKLTFALVGTGVLYCIYPYMFGWRRKVLWKIYQLMDD